MKKCVFAGTFDPPTKGHEDVVKKCLKIFDEVVIAVMSNPAKTPLFTEEERVFLLEKLFGEEKGVRVRVFKGAAVDLLESENTPFYVRGVRNTVDFEYENADYFASKKLKEDMITLYIPCGQENLHISSTMVKNFLRFGKDYADMIPDAILKDVQKLSEKKDV